MPAKAKSSAMKKSKPSASRTAAKRAAPARKIAARPARRTAPVVKNKALVRRLIEQGLSVEARTNPDVLHEYFADHFVDHVPVHHEMQGVHGVKDAMSDLHDSTHAFQMSVTHLVAEGEWVAVHWQATSARHRELTKHRQLKNIAPADGERTAAGITLFRVQRGKIVESWNYDNALELAMRARQ